MARILDEGMHHSQLMQTLSYLTDVIGPRLTGSPNLKHANEWTRHTLETWGLTNAHVESWGPFGRGWSLKSFSAQVTAPYAFPVIAFPKAWTPGLEHPVTAEVVYLNAKTAADLEKYKGKLKGAIVFTAPAREVKAHFEPLATRMVESNLLRLANAGESRPSFIRTNRPAATPTGERPNLFGRAARTEGRGRRLLDSALATNQIASGASGTNIAAGGGTTNLSAAAGPPSRARTNEIPARVLEFLLKEGAALAVTPSSQGDGGTLFVAAASVPAPETRRTNGPSDFSNRISAWATNAPPIPPQITVSTEDYNRIVRIIEQGEKVKMSVALDVQFHDDDLMAWNTIAEIPGTDLKDELVMVGAHMDSWHSGTGATDNGAGVAAAMEAVRILKALDLKPRRTVRVALWSGEEEGLLGSRAYVAKHFGYYTNMTNVAARSPRAESNDSPGRSGAARGNASRKLVRQAEYDRLSAYFNLDNGTGKIRGVYMQGNEAVRPLFRRWLQPWNELGAETLTVGNTGGTDHLSFDAIGLPGFQFIQDPIDYFSRTHHSNADVYDRAQADDLKQAATIMAAFVYNTAMLDEKMPRKALE